MAHRDSTDAIIEADRARTCGQGHDATENGVRRVLAVECSEDHACVGTGRAASNPAAMALAALNLIPPAEPTCWRKRGVSKPSTSNRRDSFSGP